VDNRHHRDRISDFKMDHSHWGSKGIIVRGVVPYLSHSREQTLD